MDTFSPLVKLLGDSMASPLLDMTPRTKSVVENLVISTFWYKQSIL
jgi:hypothetical protein